jgi:hypothetical protein
MTLKFSAFLKTLIIASALCTVTANAADDFRSSNTNASNDYVSEYKPSIGLLAGVTSPEGSSDEEAAIGLDYSLAPTKSNLTLGGEYLFSQIGSSSNEDDQHTLLLKAGYSFGGDTMIIKQSWVALGVGAVLTDNDTLAVASPMVGFDIPVTSQERDYLSLGANARYNFIENVANTDDTFTLAGAVKFWY